MIYLFPFIAAFIGWGINHLAVKMLFHPREPKSILGFKLQGIFPKNKTQIAAGLGQAAANGINLEELGAKIKDPEVLKDLAPFIEKHIDEFLHIKLKEKLPVVSMFIGDSTITKLKDGLLEEIEVLLPQLLGQFVDKLTSTLDIEKMVREKVEAVSNEKLEELVYKNMSKQIKAFEMLGAVAGFIISALQLLFTYLVS